MKKIICMSFLSIVTTCYAAPPAIVQSGERFTIIAPATITEPGTYYVGRDFIGTITVAASDVYLDLNGKTLENTGNSIIVNGQENVFIYNGQIQNTTDHAIRIDDCANVSVADITFSDIETIGVFVSTSSNIDIHDVAVLTSTCYGGIYIQDSQSIAVRNCAVNNNAFIVNPLLGTSAAGYAFTNCFNVAITDCIMQANSAAEILSAYFMGVSKSIQLIRCLAIDNTSSMTFIGFFGSSCVESEYIACSAQRNSALQAYGSLYLSNNNLIVQNCTVLSCNGTNAAYGFWVNAGQSNFFEKCTISQNESATSCIGIRLDALDVGQVSDCILSDNSSDGSTRGISADNVSNLIISQCVCSANSSSNGEVVGFNFNDAVSVTLRNNFASNNTGSPSTDSYGFRFTGSPTLCTLFANQAEGHDSEANNFSVGSVSIPKVIFRRASNIWSAPPTPVDNISIEES